MLKIKLIRFDNVVVFAAEQLKKYLRMMMPYCGDIEIVFEPDAKDGFRLGLLQDFGLKNDAEDPVLDDIVHIDTDVDGGILAGSNPRSVLFAVYRFLRLNGCRWLYPGVDGEHIPLKDIEPIKYHKQADHRFRGHCNEGAESQTCMLETIDFYAKQEINVYMIEFDNPYAYYNCYYSHRYNEKNRIAEPVPYEQVMQWKRECEVEIAKRGLMFHDMGHGWTAEPFGIPSTEGWKVSDFKLTDEQRECLALVNGKRDFHNGVPLNTNLCMSNPKVRKIMVDGIVNYAKTHSNVDYLHVWLADGTRNHCECDECKKLSPSDYYLMIMNELDEQLTQNNLSTRIVFIAYVDTMFPPQKVTIKNPDRFSLLYAPITRAYHESFKEGTVLPKPQEYVRNDWKYPVSAEENIALLDAWQQNWHGPCFSYEYHFWVHQYKDPSGLYIAKRIYEDIRALKYINLDGFVEDGSQRSFFPTGFAIYVYAETLLNRDVDFEELKADYFSHVYGEGWQDALEYLQNISDCFDFAFMTGCASVDESLSKYYDPSQVTKLLKVEEIAKAGRELAKNHLVKPTRPQTVSWRLLSKHTEYCEGFARFMIERCQNNNDEAYKLATEFFDKFGKYEVEIERYYDHLMSTRALIRMVDKPKVILQMGL